MMALKNTNPLLISASNDENHCHSEVKMCSYGSHCCAVETTAVALCYRTTINHIFNVQIVAVAARSLDRAKQFAETHGIRSVYGSYESIAQDPDVG